MNWGQRYPPNVKDLEVKVCYGPILRFGQLNALETLQLISTNVYEALEPEDFFLEVHTHTNPHAFTHTHIKSFYIIP